MLDIEALSSSIPNDPNHVAMMLKLPIAIYLLMLASNGFARGGVQRNIDKLDTDTVRIALVPFFQKPFDDDFFAAFNKERFIVVDTAQISHYSRHHEHFNKTMTKVVELAVNKTKYLFSSLTENEIFVLKKNNLNADILLVHTRITSKTVAKPGGKKTITLKGGVMAYDLASGQFLLYCSASPKTEYMDEAEGITYAFKKLAEELFVCFSSKLK